MKTNKQIFAYVVAGKWPDGSLSPYSRCTEVQNGTIDDAKDFLEYVNSREDKIHDNYKIYKLVELYD